MRLHADLPGPPRGAWGLEAMRGLLRGGDLPDGVVCHNDLVAFGVYRALRQERPDDWDTVHVVSYDDVAAASLWEPPLTTIAASGHDVGLRCAKALLRRISEPGISPERVLIDSELVIRESCGCRPSTHDAAPGPRHGP
jgi:LacI family transcriptional regulator